jgi:glutamyl-tRNA reductase
VIELYRDAIEKVRAAELKRLHNRLPKLDERSALEVHQLADRIVAIMVEPPLDSLREESDTVSRNTLLNALRRLFQLND